MAATATEKEQDVAAPTTVQQGVLASPIEDQRESKDVAALNVEPEPPFTIFSPAQKTFIIMMTSLAALFSPLTANIYYPALDTLASDLHVSHGLINLSITTYLIFQGLAPSFIGSLSDETGRRPSYIICFIIYLGACIGLALQNSYAALMVLRCLQSSGSSGTVALANAVVADMVTSSERGSYIGYVSMGALLGPTIGPIIGGLLNEFLGWRSIFWFCTIFGGVTLVILLLFMPETCRKIVGNGSFAPQPWNVSALDYFARRRAHRNGIHADEKATLNFKSRPNPLQSVYILIEKESGIVLMYAGLLFAGFYMVITAIPSQLQDKYGLSTLQVGLCYIPSGIGSLLAAIVVGRFMDWNFRRHAKMCGLELLKTKQPDLDDFPLEAARLQVVLPLSLAACLFTIAYGWVLQERTHLAGPLILTFFITFCTSATFQGTSTLVVDLNRDAPGAATAAMNLARCWLGAGGTAMVIPMLNKMGNGWVCVFVAGVWALMSPVTLYVIRRGPAWRKEKREKTERKKREEEAARRATMGLEDGL
ncbi:MAG: hypothetical protein M1818_007221 [Claussenomyces sp. TS43310]|nr:MAG: hypothetical protein M1818_007221 [Claussenomyces sp. TS43310]